MAELLAIPAGYEAFLRDLKERIRAAQVKASLSVNRELVLLYWTIGRNILDREKEEGWGAKVISKLADDLSQAFPEVKGLRARNLRYMRAFAEAYPDPEFVQRVVAQIPWGHNISVIESVKSPTQREWYCRQTIENGWTRPVLVHQIEGGLYERQGRALTNFSRTLPAAQSELAQQILKDPYNFDFLTLGPEMLERDLERGLIEHVRDFILELGKGFAFIGSQQHIEVGGQEFYLDLLFYHYRLRCFVVVDLKIEDFKPEFAGKMNFYLSAVDDQMRHADDAPTIGIILCKGRNEMIVEYALRDANKPMGVTKYQLTHKRALPEELQADLPTAAELSKEFPLLSVMKLRIEIERELRDLANAHAIHVDSKGGLFFLLKNFEGSGLLPGSALDLQQVISAMNRASHGLDVDEVEAELGIEVGTRFLVELRAMRESSPENPKNSR